MYRIEVYLDTFLPDEDFPAQTEPQLHFQTGDDFATEEGAQRRADALTNAYGIDFKVVVA